MKITYPLRPPKPNNFEPVTRPKAAIYARQRDVFPESGNPEPSEANERTSPDLRPAS